MEEEKKDQVPLGVFTTEEDIALVNDVDSYVKLVNENKPKGTKSISRTGLIRSYFKELLANKVLVKDFIEFDKENYYYFNKKELLENGTVKAVPEKPSSDFNNIFLIKKIPNNLDSFNAEANSYSYGTNSNVHKGIFIYHEFYVIEGNSILKPVPLLFKYDAEAEEIIVSLISFEEFKLFIETKEDSKTINDLLTSEIWLQENYLDPETLEVHIEYFDLNVIEDFKGRKRIELAVDGLINLGAEEELPESFSSVNLENPIEDLINSNVAKDKEIKEINEKYIKPMKEVQQILKDLGVEEIVDKAKKTTWEDVKNEY